MPIRPDDKKKTKVLASRHMALRTCKVSMLDTTGIEHTVQVTAQTLYEAVAQALRVFREHDWYDEDLCGSAASVVVKIMGFFVYPRKKV